MFFVSVLLSSSLNKSCLESVDMFLQLEVQEICTGIDDENSHKLPRDLYTGRFIMFSVITNIYNKKTKGPTFVELFTATGKLKTFF